MNLTYDEYKSLGGTISESDFLRNSRKSISYINRLAKMYTVSYSDENVKFALAELTDTYQAEAHSEEDIVNFTASSYTEKTVKATVDYEKKRYRIASMYLDISRVANW